MNPERIAETLGIAHVEVCEEVASTQDAAKQAVSSGKSLPCLVYARRQSRGRGRMGRTWLSRDGGLYFTLAVNRISEPWALPLVSAYLIHRKLSSCVEDLALKWPNDILHRDAKLAGVLVEGWHDCLGVGVGVNINQEWSAGETPVPATSLFMLTGRVFDLEEMLCSLARIVMRGVDELGSRGFRHFYEDIREALLASRQPVQFHYKDTTITAALHDITSTGDAFVELKSGKRIKLPIMHVLGIS